MLIFGLHLASRNFTSLKNVPMISECSKLAFQNLLRNHLSGSFSPSQAPEVTVHSPGQCVPDENANVFAQALSRNALASLVDAYSSGIFHNSWPAIAMMSLVSVSMSSPKGCL